MCEGASEEMVFGLSLGLGTSQLKLGPGMALGKGLADRNWRAQLSGVKKVTGAGGPLHITLGTEITMAYGV